MELVSVIIADLFERHLPETIENLEATADGPIEIIVKKDDQSKGMRYCLNRAAEEANGKFLFKVDGHCILTPHWDTILKTMCDDERDMAVCRIKPIDEDTWTVIDERGFGFVTINHDLSIQSSGDFVADDLDVSETMASIGCGWMIHKKRYFELDGCWEQLGRYGNLGVEWALKVWLSGGKTLVNRHVVCGHLFRKQLIVGCNSEDQAAKRPAIGKIFASREGPCQVRPLEWLSLQFNKRSA